MNKPKIIVLLDITISDTNSGNIIIMEAIEKHLRSMFPSDFFIKVPCSDRIGIVSKNILKKADLVFLCGANTLCSHLPLVKPWRITIFDAINIRNKVITVGVGWLRYKRLSEKWMFVDPYTKLIYKLAFSKTFYHSVRDKYAENKLRHLGFKVINTGCPSLWSIDRTHCLSIPQEKGKEVVFTLTYYRPDVVADRKLLSILRRCYTKIYFWPQQPQDISYFLKVVENNFEDIEIISPHLEVFDRFLNSNSELDYVGTRLHAYIRAVQHGKRAINIVVDDRGKEMGEDFNLTIVHRGEWEKLEQLIEYPFETKITVPQERIYLWKKQFIEN